MNRVVLCVLASILLLPFNSCIKEDLEKCPVQFTVKVFVEDKQYINIDEAPQLGRKNENQPFREFVGTLYYILKNRATGEITLASSFTPVLDNVFFYTIVLNDIPEGMYDLTVWGNVTQEAMSGILHQNHTELADLYLGSAQVEINKPVDETQLNLKRAKGNLVLLCNNFPSNITQMEENVSAISQMIDPQFVYTGSDVVSKSIPIQPVNQFFLAPTASGKTSKVNLHFYNPNDSADAGNLRLPEINMTVLRNKVSLISVDYKKETQSWEIWTSIDGKWTLIHKLGI